MVRAFLARKKAFDRSGVSVVLRGSVIFSSAYPSGLEVEGIEGGASMNCWVDQNPHPLAKRREKGGAFVPAS